MSAMMRGGMTAMACLHLLLLRSSTTLESAHTEQSIDGGDDVHFGTYRTSVAWVHARTPDALSDSDASVESECHGDTCHHEPSSFVHKKPFESDEGIAQSVDFDHVSGWRDLQLGTLDARRNSSESVKKSRKARRRQARCLVEREQESEIFGWLSMVCGAVLGMLVAVYPPVTWACITITTGVYFLIADLHFWGPLCAALSANFWCATAWIGWCVSPTLGAGLAMTAVGMRRSLLLFMDPNDIPRPLNASEPSALTAAEQDLLQTDVGTPNESGQPASQKRRIRTLINAPSDDSNGRAATKTQPSTAPIINDTVDDDNTTDLPFLPSDSYIVAVGGNAARASGETVGSTDAKQQSAPSGKGGNDSGSGDKKNSDEPTYTPPPDDALIRGWGWRDWLEFGNISKWSMKRWMVQLRYWKMWFWEHRWELYQDCLIGFAVALAQVPEAIAFAFVAGMPPIIGLYGTIILGFFTSLFGGRPGMISGTSGAVGVVQAKLITDFNNMSPQEQQDTFGTNNPAEVVFATLLLMGGVEMVFGLFQIGRIVELVGTPAMIGFVNGLAMLIAKSQMSNFKRFDNETRTSDDPFYYEDKSSSFVEGTELGYTLLLVFSAMATMFIIPIIMDYFTDLDATTTCMKFAKVLFRALSTIPPTLYAIFVTLAINQAADLGTLTVQDKAIVEGEMLAFHAPDVKWSGKMVEIIIVHAIVWAAVSMVEGVMTMILLSEIIGDESHIHQDMWAQGLGNLMCGLFRGQGGDAMIGQSLINVKSGGIRRRSGCLASVFILIFLVVAYDFINIIPLGGLAGVMFVIVIFTFEWNTFKLFFQIPIVDSIVIIVVTLVTFFTSDLSLGVACGLAISCLHYAYTSGRRLSARTELFDDHDEDGNVYRVKIYHLDGNLFFGSLRTLQKLMTPDEDPEVVILHLNNAKTFDMSAAQGLADVTQRYSDLGKSLRVAGLSEIDAKSLSKIRHFTKGLTIDDYNRSVGDHHFERKREMRKGKRGLVDRIFGGRVTFFNPERVDVGQSSNLPHSWEAPHHHVKDD